MKTQRLTSRESMPPLHPSCPEAERANNEVDHGVPEVDARVQAVGAGSVLHWDYQDVIDWLTQQGLEEFTGL